MRRKIKPPDPHMEDRKEWPAIFKGQLKSHKHNGFADVNGGHTFVWSDRGRLQHVLVRRCRNCDSPYPYLTDMPKKKRYCPACLHISGKTYANKWAKANRAKYNAWYNAWSKHNKDKIRAYSKRRNDAIAADPVRRAKRNKYAKEWARAHRDEVNARHRARRAERANEIRARDKAWRDANKDKVLGYGAKYRAEHPPTAAQRAAAREKSRLWRQRHPDYNKEYARKRKAERNAM